VEVVASLSQCRTAAAQCGLFTYKSVLVIFDPPCILIQYMMYQTGTFEQQDTSFSTEIFAVVLNRDT